MLAFHMFCAESRDQAAAIAREPLNFYLKSIVDAASEWMSGVASKDYPNYQKMIEFISKESFESQVAKGSAWIGTPEDIRKTITAYDDQVDGFESRLAPSQFRNDKQSRCRTLDEIVCAGGHAAFQ